MTSYANKEQQQKTRNVDNTLVMISSSKMHQQMEN